MLQIKCLGCPSTKIFFFISNVASCNTGLIENTHNHDNMIQLDQS